MTAAHALSSGPSILVIEAGLTLVAVALALCWPRAGAGVYSKLERGIGQLASKRALAICLAGAIAGLLRLAILPLSPLPQPFLTDDFSYLLAAETFAAGRLTNPSHPMWVHFETFHIAFKPTYMSMYFPAQGMVLAAGKILAGHAWWGVWASCVFMCAAFCWMLQAWLPPGWALFGSLLAALRLALSSYWIDSYMGGAVPAIGGALVLGALPRIQRTFRLRDFFWLALGMAILANSRPYEGLLVCVPALAALAWSFWKKPHPAASILLRRAAPAMLLLLGTLAFMGYYNQRVFGHVLTPPYQADRAMYASAPHFVFQKARLEPVYRHRVLREFYSGWELHWFEDMQTPQGFFRKTVKKLGIAVLFYFGTVLLVPLVMLPKAILDRRIRFLVITGGVFAVGLGVETWLLPHYIAPFAAGVYAILLQCMRHLRACWPRGRSAGLLIVRAIPVLCVVLALVRLYAQPLHIELPGPKSLTAYGIPPLGAARARVLKQLANRPGNQLAIVRYSPDHDAAQDWVYNLADIDSSKVVWAREMDRASNRELLEYYKGRTIWLVQPDSNPPRVSPYPDSNLSRAKRDGGMDVRSLVSPLDRP